MCFDCRQTPAQLHETNPRNGEVICIRVEDSMCLSLLSTPRVSCEERTNAVKPIRRENWLLRVDLNQRSLKLSLTVHKRRSVGTETAPFLVA